MFATKNSSFNVVYWRHHDGPANIDAYFNGTASLNPSRKKACIVVLNQRDDDMQEYADRFHNICLPFIEHDELCKVHFNQDLGPQFGRFYYAKTLWQERSDATITYVPLGTSIKY